MDVAAFAQLATKFVYATPGAGQEVAAAGDVILWRGAGAAYQVADAAALDADLDYTMAGGVKLYVLPGVDGAFPLNALGPDGAAFKVAAETILLTADRATLYGPRDLESLLVRKSHLVGGGVLKAATGAAEVMRLGTSAGFNTWRKRKLEGFIIDGNAKASDGIVFANPTGTALAGRWTLNNIHASQCARGIVKPNGNIGNLYHGVGANSCDFGFWAKSTASPLAMHAGSDHFVGGEFSSIAKAAFYIDSPQDGTAQTTLEQVVIEGCPGFGVFVKNYNTKGAPLTLRNVWFELNATAASVEIDSVSYVPASVHFENVNGAVIEKSHVILGGSVAYRFINSSVLLDECFFPVMRMSERRKSLIPLLELPMP